MKHHGRSWGKLKTDSESSDDSLNEYEDYYDDEDGDDEDDSKYWSRRVKDYVDDEDEDEDDDNEDDDDLDKDDDENKKNSGYNYSDIPDESEIDDSEELFTDDVKKNIKRFDSFLSSDSPYNVRIPPELQDWELQWERFKGYMAIVNNPSLTKKDRDAASYTIQIELIPLIKQVAARYYPTYINQNTYEDMLAEGRYAIQASLRSYDPMRSPPISYFKKQVLHGITVYVQTMLMQSTRVAEQNANKIKKATAHLIAQGIPADSITPAMIAKKTKMPVATVEEIIDLKSRQGVMPMPDDKTVATRDPSDDPEKAYEQKEQQQDIQTALDSLSELEKDIVVRIIMNGEAPSVAAEIHGIRSEECSIVLNRALSKLRDNKKIQQYRPTAKKKKSDLEVSVKIPLLGGIRKSQKITFFTTDDDVE